MAIVYIGIGSNLGDREKNINGALNLLKENCKIIKGSSLYETEPVGIKGQDLFLNGVVEIETELSPKELLLFLQSIEKKLKRVRVIKNGPRTIDLDILFYGSKVINEPDLTVPHPRLHERLFVLMPLEEIAPGFIHPALKKSISCLVKDLRKNMPKYKIIKTTKPL